MLYRAVVEVYVRADSFEEADAIVTPIVAGLFDVPKVDMAIFDNLEEDDEDDDPQCVCGVYRSEHALCGCGEWERRR